MEALSVGEQKINPAHPNPGVAYRAPTLLQVADAVVSIGAAIALAFLFCSTTSLQLLLPWVTIAVAAPAVYGIYIYRHIFLGGLHRYLENQRLMLIYRFTLSLIWVPTHYFALYSGDPIQYIMPAVICELVCINVAYSNMSVARYIAAFIPQAISLIYVTTQLPSEYQIYTLLAITIGVLLTPAAYVVQRVVVDFRDTQNQATEAQESLKIAAQRLKVLAENSHDIISLLDNRGRHLFVSDSTEQVFGVSAESLIGRRPGEFVHPEDAKRMGKAFFENRSQAFYKPMRNRFYTPEGRLVWLESIIRPIDDPHDTGALFAVTSRDVTEQMQMESELRKQASVDSLTGCMNRSQFELFLKEAVADSQNEKVQHALLYLDMDQFKIINDSCGHQAGDKLLCHVATELHEHTADRGIVARLGGDEFAILLNHVSAEAAAEFAESLCNRMGASSFEYSQQKFSCALSIGVAMVDAGANTAEEVLSRADIACYVAKSAGRNCYHLWIAGDQMVTRHSDYIQLSNQVQQALENERIHILGQPITNLQTNDSSTQHVEVLSAIETETGDVIPPTSYLPALEHFGQTTAYDLYIINHSLTIFAAQRATQNDWAKISINLSAQTICNQPSLERIKSLIEQSQVSPSCICFEITETAQLDSVVVAAEYLQELKTLGCSLALDDFGSGHSSFEHLLSLPFDIVKIDGQFVTELAKNPSHQSIIRSVCELADSKSMATV
ncbi:MAG: EAL domain-containing protein, partial [Gammaproteobacteria bacterium]|nr:EAL domain-containing protein [Gammaproteobacteria bacterium]